MNEFNFDRVLQNFEHMKREVPLKVANASVNYFTNTWKKQGFGSDSWQPRKKETKKTQGKAILVGTGKLRKAVQGSLKLATFEKIQLVVDLPYAAVHNYGLHAGRGAGFEMPKRQFMGDNKELRELQIKTYKNAIDKIWK
jgi:phage gpG-like protein